MYFKTTNRKNAPILIQKYGLLFSLSITIILIGCEKKNNGIDPIQLNIIISEKTKVEEEVLPVVSVMETTVDNYPETAEMQIEIKSIFDLSADDSIQYVDKNITKLEILKTLAISFEGLGQLEHLETIIFDKTPNINDFSFLSEIPNLKKLYIIWGPENINWNFLRELPNLEVLHVEDYFFKPVVVIDLVNNHSLEYIGFKHGHLEIFPILNNMPNSLKYINLEGNKITSLPLDIEDYNDVIIFMGINPIQKNTSLPDNIILEGDINILEEKYHVPTNKAM